MKKKKKTPDQYDKRASSDFSFFNSNKAANYKEEHSYQWLSDIWRHMSIPQRIQALAPYNDEQGRNALILMVRENNQPLLVNLLSPETVMRDLSLNHQDMYGNTALHHAAILKHEQTLSTLLQCERISTSVKNHASLSVYDIVEKSGGDAFSLQLQQFCYLRCQLDTLLETYARTNEALRCNVTLDEITVTLIRQLSNVWTISNFANYPMPLELIPETWQRKRIEFCLKTIYFK
jgi:hypothetical protein